MLRLGSTYSDGGWARGHDEKREDVECAFTNRISKLYSRPEVISVCGHMIHGVYVQSKVLRGQVTQTCFFPLAPHGNHAGHR